MPSKRHIDYLIWVLTSLILTSCAPLSTGKPPKHIHSLYIAGDSGTPHSESRPLELLAKRLNHTSKRSTLVLLGDSIFPDGIPHDGESAEKTIYESHLRLLSQTNPPIYFIPGNHDWGANVDDSSRLERQNRITTEILGRPALLPPPGCPGPAAVRITETLALIAVDSELLLRMLGGTKASPHCEQQSVSEVMRALEMLSAEGPYVFVMHHPLKSFGPNSRLEDMCPQRMKCDSNKRLRASITQALRQAPALACAAGHDHTLQIIAGDDACQNYLVSGGMSNLHDIAPGEDLIRGWQSNGFMELRLYSDQSISLHVWRLDGAQALTASEEVFSFPVTHSKFVRFQQR